MRFTTHALIAAFIVLTTLGAVGVSSAAADTIINEKALPKGMTVAQATEAAKKAKALTSVVIAKRNAEAQKQAESALAALDPLKTKMQELAKSDPEYKAFVDKALLIMDDKSRKSRSKALNDHYSKGKATVERVYKKAGGDRTKDNRIVLKFYRELQAVLEGILTFYGDLHSIESPPPATIASKITFTAPYAVHDTDTSKNGIGFTTVTTAIANNNAKMELSAEATSVGLGTWCSASGNAGVFVDVPPGKHKVNVKVQYNYSFKGGVWAACGVGTASMSGFIFLQDVAAGTFVTNKQLDFESALAVVAWYAEVTNDESSFVILSGAVTPGKRYLINFGIDASAFGSGGGGGGSFVTLTPTAMEVEFLD